MNKKLDSNEKFSVFFNNPLYKGILKEISSKYSFNMKEFSKWKDFRKNIFSKYDNLSIENLIDKNDIPKIKNLIEKNKKGELDAYLFGDYDVDGLTSSLVAKHYLNFKDIVLPERSQGYGLNTSIIKNRNKDINSFKDKLIITVDNGVSKGLEIEKILIEGGFVLLTDHHKIKSDDRKKLNELKEKYPDNFFISHHEWLGTYGNKYMSGCQVALKTFAGLYEKEILEGEKTRSEANRWRNMQRDLHLPKKNIVYSGLSILSDVININSKENKYLVKEMIDILNEVGIKQKNPKLQILKDKLNIGAFDIDNISFKFIPLLNGTGRMNFVYSGYEILEYLFNPKIGNEVFIEILNDVIYSNQKKVNSLGVIFDYVIDNVKKDNYEKKDSLCICISKDKLDKNFNKSILNKNMNVGFSGLVANKIVSELGKNAFIFVKKNVKDDIYEGSIRGINNVLGLLNNIDKKHPGLIEGYGGHEKACGVKIKEENIKKFIEIIENYKFKEDLKKKEIKQDFIPLIDNKPIYDKNFIKFLIEDFGFPDTNKFRFGVQGNIYKIDEKNNKIIIKDIKNNKRFDVSIDSYNLELIKQNYEIGEDINFLIKPILGQNTKLEEILKYQFSGLNYNIDETPFIEKKKYVDDFFEKSQFKEMFDSIKINHGENNSYNILYKKIKDLNDPNDIYKTNIEVDKELNYFKNLYNDFYNNNNILKLKDSINKFIMLKEGNIDSILEIEKERLSYSNSRIIPFLYGENNSILISNNDDVKKYSEFERQRNFIFFEIEKIFEEIKKDDFLGNKFSGFKFSETKVFINETLLKRLSFETKNLKGKENFKKYIKIKDFEKTIQLNLNKLNGLQSDILNYYNSRYTLGKYFNEYDLNFIDVFERDKEKLSTIYQKDKKNNVFFYNEFKNFEHFYLTTSIVFKDKNTNFNNEIINYLNNNVFNKYYDDFIDFITSKRIDKDIINENLFNNLSEEAKYLLIKSLYKNIQKIENSNIQNILDIVLEDKNSIFQKILSIYGLKDLNIKNILIELHINNYLEDNYGNNIINEEEIDENLSNLEINDISNVKIRNTIDGLKDIMNNNKNNYLLNIKKFFVKDNVSLFLKNEFSKNKRNIDIMLLCYMHDVLNKESEVKILNVNDISFLKKEVFFLNSNYRFFFNFLNETKSHLLDDLNKGLFNFITKESIDNKGISNYLNEIFNVYGIDSTYIRNEIKNSFFINKFFDKFKNKLKEKLDLNFVGLDQVREILGTRFFETIDKKNNYGTSKGESIFIHYIKRILPNEFNIIKTNQGNFSYKDLIKETFGLLSNEDKEKMFIILNEMKSLGKYNIPDFIIRNNKGKIVGIGEIYGGGEENEDYEKTKTIKNEILSLLAKYGIRTFKENFNEKNKNFKINNFVNKVISNEVKYTKRNPLKELYEFLDKKGIKEKELFLDTMIGKFEYKSNFKGNINKHSISNLIEQIDNGRRYIVYDFETTGFKTMNHNRIGSTIIQLAYNLEGQDKNFLFKEYKDNLSPTIENLTGLTRDLLKKEGVAIYNGILEFLKDIIGKENLEKIDEKYKFTGDEKDTGRSKFFATNYKQELKRLRDSFAIIGGHNTDAFDTRHLFAAINDILTSKDYIETLKNDPKSKMIFEYFRDFGFDTFDTLSFSKKVLNENNNPFIGNYKLLNKNNKLGNLFVLLKEKEFYLKHGFEEVNQSQLQEYLNNLHEEIENNAHNALYDIKMNKDLLTFEINAFKKSNEFIQNESNKMLQESLDFISQDKETYEKIVKDNVNLKIIKKSTINEKDIKEINNLGSVININKMIGDMRGMKKDIKELDNDNINLNKMIKNLILSLSKLDIELELDQENNLKQKSLSRISIYKKYNYSQEKLLNITSNNGISEDRLVEDGIISYKITKGNMNTLQKMFNLLGIKDFNEDFYKNKMDDNYLKFSGKPLKINESKYSAMYDKIMKRYFDLTEDNVIELLNKLVIMKKEVFNKLKNKDNDYNRNEIIFKEFVKKILNSKLPFNILPIEIKDDTIGIYEIEIKLNDKQEKYIGKTLVNSVKLLDRYDYNVEGIKKYINNIKQLDNETKELILKYIIDKKLNNKELRNTIRGIHEDITNYSTTVIRHINYVKDKYTTL